MSPLTLLTYEDRTEPWEPWKASCPVSRSQHRLGEEGVGVGVGVWKGEAAGESMEGFSGSVHHITQQQAVRLQQVVAMDAARVTSKCPRRVKLQCL